MLPHFRQGFSWKSLINELVNIVRSDTGLYFHDGQGNSTDVGFEKILRDFIGEWEFSGYNQPVQIQLPLEALNAP